MMTSTRYEYYEYRYRYINLHVTGSYGNLFQWFLKQGSKAIVVLKVSFWKNVGDLPVPVYTGTVPVPVQGRIRIRKTIQQHIQEHSRHIPVMYGLCLSSSSV
jgi:hypothetical protein